MGGRRREGMREKRGRGIRQPSPPAIRYGAKQERSPDGQENEGKYAVVGGMGKH